MEFWAVLARFPSGSLEFNSVLKARSVDEKSFYAHTYPSNAGFPLHGAKQPAVKLAAKHVPLGCPSKYTASVYLQMSIKGGHEQFHALDPRQGNFFMPAQYQTPKLSSPAHAKRIPLRARSKEIEMPQKLLCRHMSKRITQSFVYAAPMTMTGLSKFRLLPFFLSKSLSRCKVMKMGEVSMLNSGRAKIRTWTKL